MLEVAICDLKPFSMTACIVACSCIKILLLHTTLETCGTISGQASFSSSLKFYVFMVLNRFRVSPCGVQAVKIIPKIQPCFLNDLAGLPFPPYSLRSDIALRIDSRRAGMTSAPIFEMRRRNAKHFGGKIRRKPNPKGAQASERRRSDAPRPSAMRHMNLTANRSLSLSFPTWCSECLSQLCLQLLYRRQAKAICGYADPHATSIAPARPNDDTTAIVQVALGQFLSASMHPRTLVCTSSYVATSLSCRETPLSSPPTSALRPCSLIPRCPAFQECRVRYPNKARSARS